MRAWLTSKQPAQVEQTDAPPSNGPAQQSETEGKIPFGARRPRRASSPPDIRDDLFRGVEFEVEDEYGNIALEDYPWNAETATGPPPTKGVDDSSKRRKIDHKVLMVAPATVRVSVDFGAYREPDDASSEGDGDDLHARNEERYAEWLEAEEQGIRRPDLGWDLSSLSLEEAAPPAGLPALSDDEVAALVVEIERDLVAGIELNDQLESVILAWESDGWGIPPGYLQQVQQEERAPSPNSPAQQVAPPPPRTPTPTPMPLPPPPPPTPAPTPAPSPAPPRPPAPTPAPASPSRATTTWSGQYGPSRPVTISAGPYALPPPSPVFQYEAWRQVEVLHRLFGESQRHVESQDERRDAVQDVKIPNVEPEKSDSAPTTVAPHDYEEDFEPFIDDDDEETCQDDLQKECASARLWTQKADEMNLRHVLTALETDQKSRRELKEYLDNHAALHPPSPGAIRLETLTGAPPPGQRSQDTLWAEMLKETLNEEIMKNPQKACASWRMFNERTGFHIKFHSTIAPCIIETIVNSNHIKHNKHLREYMLWSLDQMADDEKDDLVMEQRQEILALQEDQDAVRRELKNLKTVMINMPRPKTAEVEAARLAVAQNGTASQNDAQKSIEKSSAGGKKSRRPAGPARSQSTKRSTQVSPIVEEAEQTLQGSPSAEKASRLSNGVGKPRTDEEDADPPSPRRSPRLSNGANKPKASVEDESSSDMENSRSSNAANKRHAGREATDSPGVDEVSRSSNGANKRKADGEDIGFSRLHKMARQGSDDDESESEFQKRIQRKIHSRKKGRSFEPGPHAVHLNQYFRDLKGRKELANRKGTLDMQAVSHEVW